MTQPANNTPPSVSNAANQQQPVSRSNVAALQGRLGATIMCYGATAPKVRPKLAPAFAPPPQNSISSTSLPLPQGTTTLENNQPPSKPIIHMNQSRPLNAGRRPPTHQSLTERKEQKAARALAEIHLPQRAESERGLQAQVREGIEFSRPQIEQGNVQQPENQGQPVQTITEEQQIAPHAAGSDPAQIVDQPIAPPSQNDVPPASISGNEPPQVTQSNTEPPVSITEVADANAAPAVDQTIAPPAQQETPPASNQSNFLVDFFCAIGRFFYNLFCSCFGSRNS